MLKSDYDVDRASEETREAMADRCQAEGHDMYPAHSELEPRVYMKCKWCGKTK